MSADKRLEISLFLLRITIWLVMFIWTLDKFINPGHATNVFHKFYYLNWVMPEHMVFIAIAETLIIFFFLFGLFKNFSYSIVLVLHAVSTFSSYKIYMSPFATPNILFWAAWPMLAACITLFLMRHKDRFLSLGN